MTAVTSIGRSGKRALAAGVIVVASAASAGCASSEDGESQASCAFVVEYDKRLYSSVANVDFEVGRKLGPAVLPPCDDTPNSGSAPESPGSTVVYAIEGVDPAIAIAREGAPEGVLLVAGTGNDLPPEIKKLLKGS
ncbi:DUF6281 family protein [Streptomyces sp. NPDC056039]|uniref:DUF6281 family protein n=1 Tax=Streptomyces sp. NPDC056039 TaxID=3345687 RepID=UPI0035DC0720